MKGRWFLAFLLTALAGSALHFAYDLCPSPLVGLFCPVSESVWEHLKLLYAPFLVCGLFSGEAPRGPAQPRKDNRIR
mgnify:CR=1 FL=1